MDKVLAMLVLPPEDIKVQNQGLDIAENLVLKEVKCLYTEEFQNLALRILIE